MERMTAMAGMGGGNQYVIPPPEAGASRVEINRRCRIYLPVADIQDLPEHIDGVDAEHPA